tara:strand:+ start:4654 stop:4908 length:255 start_codon:yes stop_codon:yes gene_type:complete
MPYFNKLTPQRQEWIKNILKTQCSDIYCTELLETFAEKVYAIENDSFLQTVLKHQGHLMILIPFGEICFNFMLRPSHIHGGQHE